MYFVDVGYEYDHYLLIIIDNVVESMLSLQQAVFFYVSKLDVHCIHIR